MNGKTRYIFFIEKDLTGIGFKHSDSHIECRCFAGPIRAQQSHHLAAGDIHADGIDNPFPIKGFNQFLQ